MKNIRLYWWKYNENGETGANFGDELTRFIIEKLLGYEVSWADFNDADVIGIGSILQVATKVAKSNVYVWGAGYIKKVDKNKNKNLKFKLVRGKNTRSLVGKQYKNIPMGDPGILINLVFPQAEPTGKIGVVAHYLDKNHPVLDQINRRKGYILIDPLAPVETVVKQISSCRLILSSSLHGLIVADAYGVPNIHVPLSNKVTGGEYKFRDYCSGINRPYTKLNYKDVLNQRCIEKVINSYQPVKNLSQVQERILRAFPSTIQIILLRQRKFLTKQTQQIKYSLLRLKQKTRIRTRMIAIAKKIRASHHLL